MLAVVKPLAVPGFEIKEVDEPRLKEDEVLVRVINASICGTDIGIVDWGEWAAARVKPPMIFGHELLGEIVEFGEKAKQERPDLERGDLVSSETHIFCGGCKACQAGNRHICEKMELFGISRNGSFAQVTTVPARTIWKNDKTIPRDFMSVQEPFGNAVHVVDTADVKGKEVLVLGMGPVGLCTGPLAKIYGAKRVVGVEPSEYRRNLGLEMGFDEVHSTTKSELLTIENRFPVVLEMSGFAAAIEEAHEAIAPAGKMMAFGLPKKKITIEWGKYFIDKEVTVTGVFGRHIWETWEKATEILKSGKMDLGKIITHRFALSEFAKAMEVMKSGECGKVLIEVEKR